MNGRRIWSCKYSELFCDKKDQKEWVGDFIYNINIEQINWQMTADFFKR